MEEEVFCLAKWDVMRGQNCQLSRAPDLCELRLNGHGIDGRGFRAAQSQQHRPIRPVSMSGQRERSVQVRANVRHPRQHSCGLQFDSKSPRRAHRPHGV
jgi:hypothetical protein